MPPKKRTRKSTASSIPAIMPVSEAADSPRSPSSSENKKNTTKNTAKNTTKNVERKIEKKSDKKMPIELKERNEFKPKVHENIIYLTHENRRTSDIMTGYEYNNIISIRAKEIEDNPNVVFTDVTGITDPIEKAKKEIRDKRCPLSIVRAIVENYIYERWDVNELAIPE